MKDTIEINPCDSRCESLTWFKRIPYCKKFEMRLCRYITDEGQPVGVRCCQQCIDGGGSDND